MEQLNEIVKAYLKANGMKTRHFSECTRIEYSKCARWLNGESKLKPEQLKRVHQFLNGDNLKTVEDILNRGN